MAELQVPAERDESWWVPGLVGTVLLPVWLVGFVILSAAATLLKFGDTGCDDGSSGCMGPGHGTQLTVALLLGGAAVTALTAWLLPHRRRLRTLRWCLVTVGALLGAAVLVIGARSPSH
ncbi:hypothetical protein CFP65_0358 [Kitasatospora sp. MMS16-BH015]|uniref:hypothetical protein n=1 Tax=Kitasatospora sp. MMS16-BH015 TaxID=2018025 RepID=UPI000CA2E022|nr:hypothetical protein [Kitasatospora sp. MMS16-BH015]AUG75330.1 hypothetical protein CFP65_0358 [Kitasatospora sp. MMS16-BH015]